MNFAPEQYGQEEIFKELRKALSASSFEGLSCLFSKFLKYFFLIPTSRGLKSSSPSQGVLVLEWKTNFLFIFGDSLSLGKRK